MSDEATRLAHGRPHDRPHRPPENQPPESGREKIIHTPQGRPLLLQDGDIFSGSGTHLARMHGNVAYDPSGRYVGTLVHDRLVFDDADSLTFGPLFVRTTHPGFADVGNISVRTLEREVLLSD
jgi:hypothetical protein